MLHPDLVTILIPVFTFLCVVLLSVAAAGRLSRRREVRARFSATATLAAADAPPAGRRTGWGLVDPARLGLAPDSQRRLRGDLVRAGYFDPNGVVRFLVWKYVLLVALPGLAYLVVMQSGWAREGITKIAVVGLVAIIAYALPDAYLSRRKRRLQDKYRVTFPDLVDMLVVCINAGLSLDAALVRVAAEFGASDAELRANLDLMAGEMRAGMSTIEALRNCADRLGLREARSFAALLQQTIELGTDLALALTVFSDEMRDRRMALAEEKAASLPPKLTLPLGIFIFPVVLIVVLAPAVLKVVKATGP